MLARAMRAPIQRQFTSNCFARSLPYRNTLSISQLKSRYTQEHCRLCTLSPAQVLSEQVCHHAL